MKIPTYIVEEHHEAFYAWNLAKLSGKVMPVCNTLYHFDEHSDMAVPRFNTSIDMLKDSIDEIRDFTYRELTIATFIVPAIYTRLIQNVVWVKVNRSNNGNKTNRMYVRSYNNEGKKLIMGKLTDLRKTRNLLKVTMDFTLNSNIHFLILMKLEIQIIQYLISTSIISPVPEIQMNSMKYISRSQRTNMVDSKRINITG